MKLRDMKSLSKQNLHSIANALLLARTTFHVTLRP
jgi:hypothetical protein